jgi:hypothetical protein
MSEPNNPELNCPINYRSVRIYSLRWLDYDKGQTHTTIVANSLQDAVAQGETFRTDGPALISAEFVMEVWIRSVRYKHAEW